MTGRYEWKKPSLSGSTGNCVEVARNRPGIVAVRDSRDPHGPKLIVTPAEWKAFTAAVCQGEFDIA
jgi:Domain of unknown function (DUF397)